MVSSSTWYSSSLYYPKSNIQFPSAKPKLPPLKTQMNSIPVLPYTDTMTPTLPHEKKEPPTTQSSTRPPPISIPAPSPPGPPSNEFTPRTTFSKHALSSSTPIPSVQSSPMPPMRRPPLSSKSASETISTFNPRPTSNNSPPSRSLTEFDPLFGNNKQNPSPMDSLPPPPPIHNQTVSDTLSEIAKELSTMIPRKEEDTEDEDDVNIHSMTLGQTPKDSTGSKKSHAHQKWPSMGSSTTNKNTHKRWGSSDGHNLKITKPSLRKAKSHSHHVTQQDGNNLISMSNGRRPNALPPPTTMTQSTPSSTSISLPPTPLLSKHMSLTGNISDPIVLRSSETDPSLHQIEIPQPDSLLTHARICALMDEYRYVDQNFDFQTLVGVSRMVLHGRVVESQRPIITSIGECADDLVVEGFFATEGHTCHDRLEVGVFSSERRREFVVCWRGRTEGQNKPVRNRDLKTMQMEGRHQTTPLDKDQPVPIFSFFRENYFVEDLEIKVFSLLERLVNDHPFCDVITTGHSLGAALATICATRYASAFPMMRVNCHAFASPRIGGKEFRALAHSLPNLKIIHIENSSDPYIESPSQLQHVGHSIRIPETKSTKSPLAYKFDKNRPNITTNIFTKKKQAKTDHEIRSYVHAMERYTHRGMPWVKGFVGETGKGVDVKGEMRNVC